jgi:hypothetical protein
MQILMRRITRELSHVKDLTANAAAVPASTAEVVLLVLLGPLQGAVSIQHVLL